MPLVLEKAPYVVVSYYRLGKIIDVDAEIQAHLHFLKPLDVRSRIYVANSGINAQLSIAWAHYSLLEDWLKEHIFLSGVMCKMQTWDQHTFPRLDVRKKNQLVAFDCAIDLLQKGIYLSPFEWRKLMEREKSPYLIDVRNGYEWEVGHFEGSVKPQCENSREFVAMVDELKQTIDPKEEIMMCCTGGIRCEFFSRLLAQNGFERVYQLEGGILEYGKQEGNAHWKGKLFVFDDRLCVDLGQETASIVGRCLSCDEPSDSYYNCANMDCNHLFLSCKRCCDDLKGCCQSGCQSGLRVRRYLPGESQRPFRKKGYYQSST